jgi:hypothetical protein
MQLNPLRRSSRSYLQAAFAVYAEGLVEGMRTFSSTFLAPRRAEVSGSERVFSNAAGTKPPRLFPEAERRMPFFGRGRQQEA